MRSHVFRLPSVFAAFVGGLGLIRRWLVAEMRGWLLVLTLVNLLLLDAIAWFCIAQG